MEPIIRYVIEDERGNELTMPAQTELDAWLSWIGSIGQPVTTFEAFYHNAIERGLSCEIKPYRWPISAEQSKRRRRG